MSPEDINKHLAYIEQMERIEMAELCRFAPVGHPYFDSRLPLFDAFNKRFKSLGGMTPEVSKLIGWRD